MIKDSVPLKKFGSPEDIANLVVFLSSEQNQFSASLYFYQMEAKQDQHGNENAF